MDWDRGGRSGSSFGSTGKARGGQFTGDTHLSPLSAKTAGQTGLNRTTHAVSSTSTWYAFAGQVTGDGLYLISAEFSGCRPNASMLTAKCLIVLPITVAKKVTYLAT